MSINQNAHPFNQEAEKNIQEIQVYHAKYKKIKNVDNTDVNFIFILPSQK